MTKFRLLEIYQNIFPWRNINDFVDTIRKSIVYTSEDRSLIAIHKPFGIGIYAARDNNVTKQNQDKLYYRLNGSPKYCLQDALNPISQQLNSKTPYKIIKGIDRYCSGLVLISNDYDSHRKSFLRSLANSRINRLPAYGYRAITSGYPQLGEQLKEKVGLELIEVDELGDYKEPMIVEKFTNRFIRTHVNNTGVYQVELDVKKVNRDLSVGLIELCVSRTNWDFARCYISSKAAFVLGDVRFSRRIREVMGSKINLSPIKAYTANEDFEPLSELVRKRLGVKTNSEIPLMLDLHKMRLRNFYPKKPAEQKDLVIESDYWPLHLISTANVLKLDMSESEQDTAQALSQLS